MPSTNDLSARLPNPQMEVRTTVSAGRSYFARSSLPNGHCVLESSTPYSYTIYKQFRNEVCSECFRYERGRRAFLTCRTYGEVAGLSFCDDRCKASWVTREGMGAIEALSTLESVRNKGGRMRETAEEHTQHPTPITKEVIEKTWSRIQKLEKSGKEIRKWKQLGLNDFQADMARYVLLALYHLFQEQCARNPATPGASASIGGEDWNSFALLQSSEMIRTPKLPELLDDHTRIYQVLKGLFSSGKPPRWADGTCAVSSYEEESSPEASPGHNLAFGDVITVRNVRTALGVDSGNSFGIWERPLIDDSELLGSAVYPLPSLFNHSCVPNVQAADDGRGLRFITTKEVDAGEQLCIGYGHVERLGVRERRAHLLEGWFFECMCNKCHEDLKGCQC